MDSSQIETGPLPPAEEKQNTASKQSQLINPLDLLICCVTLEEEERGSKEAGTEPLPRRMIGLRD
jgi:hypothetical protein